WHSIFLTVNSLENTTTVSCASIPIKKTLLIKPQAGTENNVPQPFKYGGNLTDENLETADAAWKGYGLDPIIGLVALHEDYVEAKQLPPAKKWPSDDKKEIYYLNSFHTLHCAHLIRRELKNAYAGTPPKADQAHIMHCINAIQEEIMCNAEDTPRYTAKINAEKEVAGEAASGNGQYRMCTNWNQLVKWANEHSACYSYVNRTDPDFPLREWYRFCPDGSKPWIRVE
ncbi:Phenylalanine aminomutase (L-beta-phenylalanine forming), partial [Lachnellula suecica]